jgi:fimbrial isopeptide formation D2 family protein/LPXTG-motif cell wall-anchored protein
MKRTKRMIALLIALVMVMSMSMSAFAAAPAADPFDTDLEITGLDEQDVVEFYQIIKWDPEDATNVGGWVAIAPLTRDQLKTIIGFAGDPNATPAEPAVTAVGITSELAGELARNTAGVPFTTMIVGTGEDSVVNTVAEPGMWMALINAPNNPDVVYNPVFVASDFDTTNPVSVDVEDAPSYTNKSAAKKSIVKLEKICNGNALTWATTAIGEQVSYTVNTTIPGYGDVYEDPVFEMYDEMTDLTLVETSVVVTVEGGATAGKDYTLTTSSDGYKIEFDSDFLKGCTKPTKVTVEYDAIVSTTAPYNVNLEKNEISTKYSNNPKDKNDYGYKHDEVNHFTFTIDADAIGFDGKQEGKWAAEIVKVGRHSDGTPINDTKVNSTISPLEIWQSPLENCEFKLYTDAACTKEYQPKDDKGNNITPIPTYVSDANGRITIKGLDAGTYWLLETACPAGFIKDSVAHEVKIEADIIEDVNPITKYTTDGEHWYAPSTGATGEKSYTFYTDECTGHRVYFDGDLASEYHYITLADGMFDIDWEIEPPVEKPHDIINYVGVELPSTGGMGTTLFYVVGSALVIGAAVLLISKRRMSTR